MNENQSNQVAMHTDFFDRCKCAIEHGFYMEAILMEYAAMESRMEIILGVAGLPCNKHLDDDQRKMINISHRIKCLHHLIKHATLFQNTKLDNKFFKGLGKWIPARNQYIHGLYKNELVYKQRMGSAKELAEKGYEYCRLLYNEAHRVRRTIKNHPEYLDETIACTSDRCKLYTGNKIQN